MTYQEQIAAIVANIEAVLKSDFDAEQYAEGLLEEAMPGETYFEVRGLHTKTGAPHAFSIA